MSCPSSIWCRDSNSQPLEHECPPITTRLGLLPKFNILDMQEVKMIYKVTLEKNHLGHLLEDIFQYSTDPFNKWTSKFSSFTSQLP